MNFGSIQKDNVLVLLMKGSTDTPYCSDTITLIIINYNKHLLLEKTCFMLCVNKFLLKVFLS